MTSNDQDLDTEQLIFRQIDRVLRTASLDLEAVQWSDDTLSSPTMDVDTWSTRIWVTTKFLNAFLDPIKNQEEKEEISEIIQKATDETEKYVHHSHSQSLFKKNIEVLSKRNMVFQESDEMLIEDKTENQKKEKPGLEEDNEQIDEVIE